MANIWTAASNGDINRVTELLDEGVSPSAKDENTYTPIHAAASWGHTEVLRLLLSRGGDINVADEDGETALFVVEDVDMAKLMIELGANASHRNGEDETAAQRHLEENPTISAYLASITNEEIDLPSAEDQQDMDLDRSVDQSSSALMSQVQDIMLQSERDGTDPEPALREIVTSVVTGAAQEGQAIGADSLDAESNTRPRPPVAER